MSNDLIIGWYYLPKKTKMCKTLEDVVEMEQAYVRRIFRLILDGGMYDYASLWSIWAVMRPYEPEHFICVSQEPVTL